MSDKRTSLPEALDDLFALRERIDKTLDEIEDRLVDAHLEAEPGSCPVMGFGRWLKAGYDRFWRFIVGSISGWKGNIPA